MKPILATAMLLSASPIVAQEGPRHFNVSGFDSVDVASSDKVEIMEGSAFSVVASGDGQAVQSLAITVEAGTLHVDRTPGRHRDSGAFVRVTVPTLRAASLSGSGSITLTPQQASLLRLDLRGSGSIRAQGRAKSVSINLTGSGSIDTRQLATPAITVDLSGSGSVVASATGTASIHASGSGNVEILGDIGCRVRKSGSGSVRCG